MGIQSHPAPKKGKEEPPQQKKINFFLKENPTTRHTHPPHSNSDQLNSHTQKTQTLVTISRISFYFLSVCLSFEDAQEQKNPRLPAFLSFNSSHLRRETHTGGSLLLRVSLFCCCASASSSRRSCGAFVALDFWNGGCCCEWSR